MDGLEVIHVTPGQTFRKRQCLWAFRPGRLRVRFFHRRVGYNTAAEFDVLPVKRIVATAKVPITEWQTDRGAVCLAVAALQTANVTTLVSDRRGDCRLDWSPHAGWGLKRIAEEPEGLSNLKLERHGPDVLATWTVNDGSQESSNRTPRYAMKATVN